MKLFAARLFNETTEVRWVNYTFDGIKNILQTDKRVTEKLPIKKNEFNALKTLNELNNYLRNISDGYCYVVGFDHKGSQ